MFISRRLSHKAQNHLTAILGLVDLDRKDDAKAKIRELSELIASHTETVQNEKERKRREDADDLLRQ